MRKNLNILVFGIILLLISTACLAVTGKSNSNSNSSSKEIENVSIETVQPELQNLENTSAETGSSFKPYTGTLPESGGLITKITMSLNTDGANFDPVDETTEFGQSTTIHAVVGIKKAPKNTSFTAKWFTTDVGTAEEPDKLIDESSTTTDGTRNLDFSLSPTTSFPEGTYRVEIYVNDKLDSLEEFSIIKDGPSMETSSDASYIAGVTMAKGVKGLSKDPVNPTSIFKPTDTIHAVVKAVGVPADTNFTSIWKVTDIGGVADPDTIIDTLTLKMKGDGNIDFSLSPTKPFPVGSYRVEIQINDVTAWVEEYEVK
jgi:5-hydroxyisourate hydrolase-like protein (transthyretin family)